MTGFSPLASGALADDTQTFVVLGGVATSALAGVVIVTAGVVADLSGLAGTSAVGVVQAIPSVEVGLLGRAAAGGLGGVTVSGGATAAAQGVVAAMSLGAVTVTPSIEVVLVGQSVAGAVAPVLIWGGILPDPGTLWTDFDPSGMDIWVSAATPPPALWTPVAE